MLQKDLSAYWPTAEKYISSCLEFMRKTGETAYQPPSLNTHINEGPWNHQYDQNNYQLSTAPHATPQLDVAIADEAGEYACYAGMWWTPENRLAYLEPLCTIPEFRHKGLAAAALTEIYRKTKALGATHMTGDAGGFYQKIGFQNAVKWTFWQK